MWAGRGAGMGGRADAPKSRAMGPSSVPVGNCEGNLRPAIFWNPCSFSATGGSVGDEDLFWCAPESRLSQPAAARKLRRLVGARPSDPFRANCDAVSSYREFRE